MCVSVKEADFSDTKGYIGKKKINGEIYHVLGYQNNVQNLFEGGNAMILHFPSKEEMNEHNVISVSDNDSNIFDNIFKGFQPKVIHGRYMKSVSNSVKIFDVGIYTVLMSNKPSLIYEKLKDIPKNKRPEISLELMNWYEKNYKGWSIAVCCFDSKEKIKAKPLFWYYKPIDKNQLIFPAIDSHSGDVPKKERVLVNHELLISFDTDHGKDISSDKKLLSKDLSNYINDKVLHLKSNLLLPNGDFVFKKKELKNGYVKFHRRFPKN